MTESITVRAESEIDHDAVREVHRLAFPGGGEGQLVADLRRTDEAVISLVAGQRGKILGHILFSKIEAPIRALALAPVGVHPKFQKQGIGSALIREGLKRAEEGGWAAVFVLGAPHYYRRFGFDVEAAKRYTCVYNGEHFMIKVLGSGSLSELCRLVYPAPFNSLR